MTEFRRFHHTEIERSPDVEALQLLDVVASYARAALIAGHQEVHADRDDPESRTTSMKTSTALAVIKLIDCAHELVQLYKSADDLERRERRDQDF